jgi:putative membrane protein
MALSFSKRVNGTKAYYNIIRRVAFPRSTSIIVLASFLFSTLGLGTSFLIAQRNLASFAMGAAWGIVILLIPNFAANVLLYPTVMREDPLFYLRRCLAFSLFTTTAWVMTFIVCSMLTFVPKFVFPDFAVVVGLFAVMPLRSVAVFSMSRTSFVKRTFFSLTEPTMTALSAIVIFNEAAGRIAIGWVLSSVLGLAFAFALIATIETQGRRVIGFSPIRMFRAFLTDWLEARNEELESYLKELGEETELNLITFAFRSTADRKTKGVMLVSNLHPGPFLNIGSSVLPFLFQALIERKYGALGIVPHGVSGHELNLVSQEENARVVEWVIANLKNGQYVGEATPVQRSTNEMATATCQVFDGSALVTMTAAPYDMEDIPSEVAAHLASSTNGQFRHVALIDAHNSLTEEATMPPERVQALEQAASASIKSVAGVSSSPLRVGAARNVPPEFTLKDGFGPGGIMVVATEVGGHRFAYITIDGNNMVKGLREQILAKAREVGFEDAEAMTTDTHMVNGVVSARLGYHLVGEAVPASALLNYTTATCQEAMANLEPCEVAVVSGKMMVKALGTSSLRRVMSLVYRNSKLTASTLFPLVIVLAVLSLIFLV